MSLNIQSISLTNLIYDPARLKTPNFKEFASSSEQTKGATPNPPILMDEFGQTPDHYYLAKKPPPSFFQVKRKLNLCKQSEIPDKTETKRKRRSKLEVATKSKVKVVAEKQRYDTSLGQLTKKFLKLLSDAVDGVVNLNSACTLLSVPKRRLYDITNVLEGAGLVQKTSRNNIQYMGRGSSPFCNGVSYDLEKEIDILEAKENKLDELIYHMKAEIQEIKDSEEKFHYITANDLKNIEEFSKKMVLSVNIAPSGQLEAFEKKMILSSKSSEIEAFLLEDISFRNILHPKAEIKEDSYNITITDNHVINSDDDETTFDGPLYNHTHSLFKSAYISEEDDFAPMGKNFLLQTEDQDLDALSFEQFKVDVDSYSFSLDDGEGLTDLFDCHFPC